MTITIRLWHWFKCQSYRISFPGTSTFSVFFQIHPTNSLSCRQTEVLKVNKAYLWPLSNVWIRAYEARIQTAVTKVTNMLYLSLGVRLLCSLTNYFSRYKYLYISSHLFHDLLLRIPFPESEHIYRT